jgi:hypothetical protein
VIGAVRAAAETLTALSWSVVGRRISSVGLNDVSAGQSRRAGLSATRERWLDRMQAATAVIGHFGNKGGH